MQNWNCYACLILVLLLRYNCNSSNMHECQINSSIHQLYNAQLLRLSCDFELAFVNKIYSLLFPKVLWDQSSLLSVLRAERREKWKGLGFSSSYFAYYFTFFWACLKAQWCCSPLFWSPKSFILVNFFLNMYILTKIYWQRNYIVIFSNLVLNRISCIFVYIDEFIMLYIFHRKLKGF